MLNVCQTGSWRIALASHWGVATRGREGGSDIGCACVPHHCFKGGEVRDQVSGECDEGSLVPHLVTAGSVEWGRERDVS